MDKLINHLPQPRTKVKDGRTTAEPGSFCSSTRRAKRFPVFHRAAAIIIALAVGVLPTLADTLYGSVTFKDKSKDKGTTAISTSWNSVKGKSDGNGKFKLDFGGKVGAKVTIYVNGKRYTEVLVKGDTKLDIVVPD